MLRLCFFKKKNCFPHFDRILADEWLKTLVARGFLEDVDGNYERIDEK